MYRPLSILPSEIDQSIPKRFSSSVRISELFAPTSHTVQREFA